jgi:hypothetical protein
MPTYESLCLACQRLFLKSMTMAEADMQKIVYLRARTPRLSSLRQLFTLSRREKTLMEETLSAALGCDTRPAEVKP